MRSLEPLLRELITARLGRGKVECRLSLQQQAATDQTAGLNDAVLQQLAQMSAIAQSYFPQSRPLSVADILRWPDVLRSVEVDQEALAADVRAMVLRALQQLTDSRQREGEKLKGLLIERLDAIDQQVAQVSPLLPAQVQAYQEKLTTRLQEAVSTLDEDRLRQEVTLFAQRIDVDEELGRLLAHVSEVRRILDTGGTVGKRLDFLMQELNREANTLGSKSVSAEISQAAMTLKVLIEQMREQIQNIE